MNTWHARAREGHETQQKLTPARLDGLLIGKPERLWGAPAIAQALGVSIATVYRLALKQDCPIYKPDGRYFAYRHELDDWLRAKVVVDA